MSGDCDLLTLSCVIPVPATYIGTIAQYTVTGCIKCCVQEAQLSQREWATLRVIKYFAKSLKIIRNDNVE